MKTKLINPKFTSDFVDNLLMVRGVNAEDIDAIKNPTIANLCDYHDLVNLQAAAEYIIAAVKDKKHFVLV